MTRQRIANPFRLVKIQYEYPINQYPGSLIGKISDSKSVGFQFESESRCHTDNENYYVIYKITNKINNKVYIGKTEFDVIKRFKQHINDCSKENTNNRPLYKAMLKYGVNNFTVETIEYTDEPEAREIYWIEKYNSFKEGYNATIGGDGKTYVNREKVKSKFLELGNAKDVSECLNLDYGHVCKILKSQGFDLIKISTKSKEISVICETTGQVFESATKASLYLVKNFKPEKSDTFYTSHIVACCKGKRKSVLKHKFKYNL